MNRLEPTRLASILALACAALMAACRADESKAAPPTPQLPVALPAASASSPRMLHLPELLPVGSSAPVEPRARPVESVLVLGDSLSDEAVGGGGFVRLLRERCPGVSVDNQSKGGFMVNQMRRRLEKDVLPRNRRYSHAIVFGGVNDLYSDQTANRTLPRIEGDLSAIYGQLKARGIDVIAITVTPWGGFKKWFTPARGKNTLTLNAWILEQAQNGGVDVGVDAYPLLSCGEPDRLCPELAAPHKDGLHFGALGHRKLGESLLPHLPCPR